MASQSVVTGADGEGQGNADLSDNNEDLSMTQWLKENRLEAFVEYFKTTGITVDELLEYDDGDLELRTRATTSFNIRAYTLSSQTRPSVN